MATTSDGRVTNTFRVTADQGTLMVQRPRSWIDKFKTTGHIEVVARPSVREELVDAALREFHQRGYNGCGVKDITDAAGVPKGSFYNHFESKEAMALEALRRYGETRRIDLLTDPSKRPLDRLHDHFAFLADELEGHAFNQGCMFGNFANEMGDQSPALAQAVERRLGRWSTTVAQLLSAAQAQGDLAESMDAQRLGRFLVNAWQGATLRARVTKSAQPVEDFFVLVFESLLLAPAARRGTR